MLLFYVKYYLYAIGVLTLTYLIKFSALYSNFAPQGPTKNEYDYIIVGAGTAGTTILKGISGDLCILLIDAGGRTNHVMDIPILTPLLHGTQFDWGYTTTSQNGACKAMNENKSKWSMGKGFGGSNILNNMIMNWGHPEDFRGWFGNSENYHYVKAILPYFQNNDQEFADNKNLTMFGEKILKMDNHRGIRFINPKLYQKNGRRWTMAHEALVKLSPNHEILTEALVTKVLFSDAQSNPNSGKLRTTGVEVTVKGMTINILAKNGVFLTAGTIGTPKILLQSGIGPCDEISLLGIECKRDLPVGRNLQDHLATGMDLITINTSLGFSPLNAISMKNIIDYVRHGYGPISSCGCEVLGFLEENYAQSPPQLGFMIMPVGITADIGTSLRYIINLHDKWWDGYFKHIVKEGHQTVSILPILLHPKSRGIVKLQGTDPFKPPDINPRYFEDKRDVELLVKGLELIDSLLKTPQLRQLDAKIYERPFPGCEHLTFKSKLYWECYVRHLTLTVFHPVGTCQLGNDTDANTVVTRDYKVKGTENLFVVDASILPNLPSGNPNAVIAMLANRFLKTKGLSANGKSTAYKSNSREEL